MKKIMLGILAIFLLSVIAVGAVIGSLTWNTTGTVLPSTMTLNEDVADDSLGDLSQYVTDSEPITGFTSAGSTNIAVTFTGTAPNLVPTLTPASNWYGIETVTFTATDADDTVISPSVSVTVNSVNDDPTIVGTIPAQTKLEDSAAWTLDLTAYESDVEDLVGPSLTWSVSGVDTTKFSAVVTDINNDVVTFTPVANAFGSDLITFTLTDSAGGTDTQDVVITITSAGNDDATVLLTSIPDQKWTKGTVHTLDLKNYFSDPDDPTGLSLTYGWEVPVELATDITITQLSGIVTFTPVVDSWKGSYDVNFTATDGVHDLVKSNQVRLVVRNKPDFICEEGERGDLTIDSISDPDNGDNFKPGESIKIKLNVENSNEDDLDVVVEAFLYDETDDSVLESVESDAEEIKDGKDVTFEFYLDIPLDEDVDEDHDYKLLLKVYEDGNEDEHCVESTEIDLDLNREDHDVIISSVDLIPSTASPGETVEFTVKVVNIGATDEDDVTIRLKETNLGLDLVSTLFDLEDATSSDNDKTERFTFTVPSNIAAGTYSINVAVYDEDDDVFDTSDDAEKFVSLVVAGSAAVQTEDVKIEMVGSLPSTIEAGKTYSLPVKITNNKAIREMITVKIINIADWATSTSEKILTLDASKSETVYLSLKANEEIGEGKYSATIEAKDSTGKIYTKTITLGAEEDGEGIFEKIDMNTIFYIVGYIVLIVVAIFFIKLIFSRGKGKVKEVRL